MSIHISSSIRSVGVNDPHATLFEAQYHLPHGMSYNSYVILDHKIAVMDTVDAHCVSAWIQQLADALDGRTPDYLVVHHMEPDHTAGIEAIMRRYPDIKLVASAGAIKMLPQFFGDTDFTGRVMTVREGDTLQLGDHKLHFIAAPMVHWPEVMVSYEEREKVLFSADAFGKFGIDNYPDNWVDEARRYYINIVGKYGMQVTSLLNKLEPAKVAAIAPLHGPVLQNDILPYVNLYKLWSGYIPETRGVLVAYASIYGGTAEAARRIARMLLEAGEEHAPLMDLCVCDQSEAIAQAFRYDRMIVAAPTYDAAIYPAMHDFLHHLTLKGYRDRTVGIIENGSWAPAAGKQMRDMLSKMKGITIVDPCVTVRSRLNKDSLNTLSQLAAAMTQQNHSK